MGDFQAMQRKQLQAVGVPGGSHDINTRSRAMWAGLLIAACVSVSISQGSGPEKAPFPLPEAAPREDWEWDEDERFDELMEQLAINEASLDAVEAAIAKKSRRKAARQGEARRQEVNARMMDRKGGGPMKWDEFLWYER